MKSCRYLVVLALCLGLTHFACAFQMNVLDPFPDPTVDVLLTSSVFDVNFTPCSALEQKQGFVGNGCFEGTDLQVICTPDSDDRDGRCDLDDYHGATWDSITLTFSDPSLSGQPCSILSGTASTPSVFSDTSCTTSGSTDTLTFLDGSIAFGETFVIVEDATPGDPNPNFGTGGAVAGVEGVAPEPNSAILMATGTGMFGLLLYAERRRLLRNPLRS
jgi:hypothetical protein